MCSMRMRPIATDVALSVWVFLCVGHNSEPCKNMNRLRCCLGYGLPGAWISPQERTIFGGHRWACSGNGLSSVYSMLFTRKQHVAMWLLATINVATCYLCYCYNSSKHRILCGFTGRLKDVLCCCWQNGWWNWWTITRAAFKTLLDTVTKWAMSSLQHPQNCYLPSQTRSCSSGLSVFDTSLMHASINVLTAWRHCKFCVYLFTILMCKSTIFVVCGCSGIFLLWQSLSSQWFAKCRPRYNSDLLAFWLSL